MFIDACALVAVLSDEPEAERVSTAIMNAKKRFTSPLVVLETALALSRPDKFDLPIDHVEPIIMEFLDARAIELRDLPPARYLPERPSWSELGRLHSLRVRKILSCANLGDG